jgi:hypothetical protein
LKIVRVRDTDNKLIVFDPDVENYLNRRFGIPDGPKLDIASAAMTEQDVFLSLSQLRDKSMRVLEDHNAARIKELAQTFIDSDPSGGEGFGLRAGADQLLGNYEDAQKDADRALLHGGTVYLVAQRHGAWSNEPFTPVVLGISRKKLQYIPGPGRGSPEEIDLSSAKVKFDTGKMFLKSNRPFLSLSFKGSDGKSKTYNFAALGTACPGSARPSPNLVPVPGGGVCGSETSTVPNGKTIPLFDPNAREMPLYVPAHWQQDLTTVLRTIEEARNQPGK